MLGKGTFQLGPEGGRRSNSGIFQPPGRRRTGLQWREHGALEGPEGPHYGWSARSGVGGEGAQEHASLGDEKGQDTAGSWGERCLGLQFRKVTLAMLWSLERGRLEAGRPVRKGLHCPGER